MTFFPFTAIVKQEQLKKALLLNAINPAVGGLLIQGESGTAKSTAVRGLAELMPEITVTEGCPFSCAPTAPCRHCTERAASGVELVAHTRPRRVVDLPLNATEDRIAGALDLARALRDGVKALEPGLLAEANRGIFYIDEINLLDDHLVDLLLDAAALGVNTVEREGISVSHPARFLLVGTMNEEEGELRPQIADRLGLTVRVEPLPDAAGRAAVMRRREIHALDPAALAAEYAESQTSLRDSLRGASERVGQVAVAEAQYTAIARLVLQIGIGSHRADIAVLECSKALAALAGRDATTASDIAEAAELVVPHRLVSDPFEPTEAPDAAELKRILDELIEQPLAQKNGRDATVGDSFADELGDAPAAVDLEAFAEAAFERAAHAIEAGSSGGRPFRSTGRARGGKYTRPRLAAGAGRVDVALDATLRAAAPRGRDEAVPCVRIGVSDLREKVRAHRSRLSVAFVLDNSYSVHAEAMVEQAKGLVSSLLTDAIRRGDRVALVAFAGRRPEATVALPLTRSAVAAERRLAEIPVAGRTPLASAVRLAGRVLRQEQLKRRDAVPLALIMTDGLPTVPLRPGGDPLADLLAEARRLRRLRIATVVADSADQRAARGGCGRELARAAGGHWLQFDQLVVRSPVS